MKAKKIVLCVITVCSVLAWSCKENVLTPVANNKPADSVQNLINALNAQNVMLNKEQDSYTVQLATLNNKYDSMDNSYYGSQGSKILVDYVVYVLDGSTSFGGGIALVGGRQGGCQDCKVSSIDGAQVAVSIGGQQFSGTTVDGRAEFVGLPGVGIATVSIGQKGYGNCTFTTSFGLNSMTQVGTTFSASTAVFLFPTSGKNMVTYTGQLYINKSTVDDTLGRVYDKVMDVSRYGSYISEPSTYTGVNYFNGSTETVYQGTPYGTQLSFSKLTALAGQAFVYGVPSVLQSMYPAYSSGYPYQNGSIISLTYYSLASYASIDANGVYTLQVPVYENAPGVSIGTVSSRSFSNFSGYLSYQDSVTTISNAGPGKTVYLNDFDNYTYQVTKYAYVQNTSLWGFVPYIALDNYGYGSISVTPTYNYAYQNFYGVGGVYTRDIYFFGQYKIGQ